MTRKKVRVAVGASVGTMGFIGMATAVVLGVWSLVTWSGGPVEVGYYLFLASVVLVVLGGTLMPPTPHVYSKRGRCPWTTSASGERCILDGGHKGTCATVTSYINKRSRRATTRARFWYGINYEVR